MTGAGSIERVRIGKGYLIDDLIVNLRATSRDRYGHDSRSNYVHTYVSVTLNNRFLTAGTGRIHEEVRVVT